MVRTGEEIRDALVDKVRRAVTRPGMFASSGRDLENVVEIMLGFIAFAEGREADDAHEHLRRYGKEGVTGPFRALLGGDDRLVDEVAAVMAHQAHRRGYFEVENLLDPAAFGEIRDQIRDRFDEVDLVASEIRADLGEPCFTVGNRVWAYGSSDREAGWIFLAFRPDSEPTYEPGSGTWTYRRDTDPLLRLVWTSEGPFEETLALPLRTKLEIWGPGWEWDHGWRSNEGAPSGVRESLQAIHDADLSQRLRRSGFAE